jgi:hypothetical protein
MTGPFHEIRGANRNVIEQRPDFNQEIWDLSFFLSFTDEHLTDVYGFETAMHL